MSDCLKTPANRRLRIRWISVAFACLASYLVAFYAIPHPPDGPLPLILAGVAGAFYFSFFVAVGVLTYSIRDEFQRALLVRSFVSATILTMGITMIWGFVELGSHNTIRHLPVLIQPALLVVFTAAAKVIVFRQYKSPAE